jgi:hypothetical protein
MLPIVMRIICLEQSISRRFLQNRSEMRNREGGLRKGFRYGLDFAPQMIETARAITRPGGRLGPLYPPLESIMTTAWTHLEMCGKHGHLINPLNYPLWRPPNGRDGMRL